MWKLNIEIFLEKRKLNYFIKKYGIRHEKVMQSSLKLDKLINQIINKKWKNNKK